jgi:hypothetical protein
MVAVTGDWTRRQAFTAQSLLCHPAVRLRLWLCQFHVSGSGDSLGYSLCYRRHLRLFVVPAYFVVSVLAIDPRFFHIAITDNQIHCHTFCHTGTVWYSSLPLRSWLRLVIIFVTLFYSIVPFVSRTHTFEQMETNKQTSHVLYTVIRGLTTCRPHVNWELSRDRVIVHSLGFVLCRQFRTR